MCLFGSVAVFRRCCRLLLVTFRDVNVKEFGTDTVLETMSWMLLFVVLMVVWLSSHVEVSVFLDPRRRCAVVAILYT